MEKCVGVEGKVREMWYSRGSWGWGSWSRGSWNHENWG